MLSLLRSGVLALVALMMCAGAADAANRGRVGAAPVAIAGSRGGGAHFGAARSFARPSFGGGAARSFARPSFARPSFGGGAGRSFARPAFRGGAPRVFARPAFRGSTGRIATARALRHAGMNSTFARSWRGGRRAGLLASRRTLGSRAAQRIQAARAARAAATGAVTANRALAATNAQRAASAASIGNAFAARRAAQARWFGNWHRHHRRFAIFGWFGPVFWPYAYDDIFGDVFWPYAYAYDPFWDYGYGDIYGSLFSPYGYEDFIDTIPASRSARRRLANVARGEATGTTATPDLSRYGPLCGSDSRDVAGVPVEQIQQAVSPDDAQRAALDEVGNAAVKAAQIIKAACPTQIRLTPVGRLDVMQQRIQAMIDAVNTVRGPLDKFYGLLSDEQKARFNAIGQANEPRGSERSLVRTCGTAGVTDWPEAQIEKAVQPTAAQREKLDALRNASASVADTLKASCAAQMPATPTGRLSAVAERLDTMLSAIKTVREPLEAFYQSLSDEQKAQFNDIGRARAARQG